MPLFGPPNVEKLKAKRDVKGLIRALSYAKDVRVRRAAALALRDLGGARAVEPLIKALQDDDWDLNRSAAEALGRIGDKRAVEALVTALGSPEVNVRRFAAAILNMDLLPETIGATEPETG